MRIETLTSLPAAVIAIEQQGDQYQVIVQITTKYRGSFNTLAFGEIKPYSGSLKDGRLDLIYYRLQAGPRVNRRRYGNRLSFGVLQKLGRFYRFVPGFIQVKHDQSLLVGGANRFQSTRWSVVLVSTQSQAPGSKQALADLCKLYWYPLYAFMRHRGHSPEDAEDLAQGFFLHLVEHKTLSRIDRSKGKFRTFLLASLENFLSDEADRARCLKRGGKVDFVHFDLEGAEDRYGLESVDTLSAEKVFDSRLAMALIGVALDRLVAQGKGTTFQALRAFLDPINTKSLPPYEEAAAQLEVSVGSVKMPIHRLRKQYTALIREEVSRTLSDAADLDSEIHELCEALIAAEGWIVP